MARSKKLGLVLFAFALSVGAACGSSDSGGGDTPATDPNEGKSCFKTADCATGYQCQTSSGVTLGSCAFCDMACQATPDPACVVACVMSFPCDQQCAGSSDPNCVTSCQGFFCSMGPGPGAGGSGAGPGAGGSGPAGSGGTGAGAGPGAGGSGTAGTGAGPGPGAGGSGTAGTGAGAGPGAGGSGNAGTGASAGPGAGGSGTAGAGTGPTTGTGGSMTTGTGGSATTAAGVCHKIATGTGGAGVGGAGQGAGGAGPGTGGAGPGTGGAGPGAGGAGPGAGGAGPGAGGASTGAGGTGATAPSCATICAKVAAANCQGGDACPSECASFSDACRTCLGASPDVCNLGTCAQSCFSTGPGAGGSGTGGSGTGGTGTGGTGTGGTGTTAIDWSGTWVYTIDYKATGSNGGACEASGQPLKGTFKISGANSSITMTTSASGSPDYVLTGVASNTMLTVNGPLPFPDMTATPNGLARWDDGSNKANIEIDTIVDNNNVTGHVTGSFMGGFLTCTLASSKITLKR